jgi:MFS family permease
LRRLLADRDARLLIGGEALSMFGDSAMFLALGIWAKTLTGSNAAAGMVFFALVAPALVAPLAGYLVDRVRRRPLMIVVEVAIGISVLALLFVHARGDVWLIYAVAVVYGLAATVLGSARSALLTVMLPDDLLADANGILQTVREGLRLVAPLVGAGIFAAFGGGVVAVVDAATFAVSIAALGALRVKEPEPHEHEHRFLVELTAGVRHVFRTVPLRQIVLGLAVAVLVIGFIETAIFAVIDSGLRRPPSFFGVLEAFQGVGAIFGGLTAARAVRRYGDGRVVGVGLALFGGGDGLLAVSQLPLVLFGIAVAGFGLPWAIVGFVTAVQRRSPPQLQGRVFSAADTMVSTPQTLSIALGAVLSTVVDYRLLIGCVALVTLACGIYLLTRRTFTLAPALA